MVRYLLSKVFLFEVAITVTWFWWGTLFCVDVLFHVSMSNVHYNTVCFISIVCNILFIEHMKHEVYQVNTGSVSLLHLLATAVSCSDYSVNMPPTLETTHGSCIFIPCSFTAKDSSVRSPATGVWRKGSQWFKDGVDVFNSFKNQNKLHGKILGDLTLMFW